MKRILNNNDFRFFRLVQKIHVLEMDNMNTISIENGNIVWGKNWDLMFPIEQLYSGSLA